MADTKVSALTELTTPADEDLTLIIDDPTGTPASKHIKISNLIPSAFGQIYGTGLSGSQTLSAATWTKIDQFAANGESSNTTPDHTNDKITIATTGYYLIGFSVSFEASAALEWEFAAYWNSVQQNTVHGAGSTDDASEVTNVSSQGIVNISSGALDLELYGYCRATGGDLEIQEVSLWCHRLFKRS